MRKWDPQHFKSFDIHNVTCSWGQAIITIFLLKEQNHSLLAKMRENSMQTTIVESFLGGQYNRIA